MEGFLARWVVQDFTLQYCIRSDLADLATRLDLYLSTLRAYQGRPGRPCYALGFIPQYAEGLSGPT